jgi:GNAT superfamily N-acetyltransferase
MSGPWEVRLATADDATALGELFERSGCACFCRYHDFVGDHRAWQARMAMEQHLSQAELGEALGGQTRGLIALEGSQAVGWLRFGPRAGSRMYQLRAFKGLECIEGVGPRIASLYCLLVEPAKRRQGIARSLVLAWMEWAQGQGKELEVLARGEGAHLDEEYFSGPAALLDELGFSRVHDFRPYPVLRWRAR